MNRRQFFSKTVLTVAAAGLSGFVARSVSQIGIPVHGTGKGILVVFDKKFVYGRIAIPWEDLKDAKPGTFMKAARMELEGIQQDTERILNRWIYRDGAGLPPLPGDEPSEGLDWEDY